jgi:hypothetical protein
VRTRAGRARPASYRRGTGQGRRDLGSDLAPQAEREARIREFHEENFTPVVGLREGAMLRIECGSVELRGRAGARIVRRGQEPVEVAPVASIQALLA